MHAIKVLREKKELGLDNVVFQIDESHVGNSETRCYFENSTAVLNEQVIDSSKEHATWNNSVEFLMSCIAVSVGFGNIWRFPFTAYENGGGAFLIPYVVLLFLVGKPFYFLEMIIGQFSGSSSVKVWNMSPSFVGVGWAQFCSTVALATYYSSLMALTLYYLIASFSAELPWATCLKEWGDACVDSSTKRNHNANNATEGNIDILNNFLNGSNKFQSSAELYFSMTAIRRAFFFMMFVLGVGSAVGMTTGIITVINEQFPNLKTWQIVVPTCLLGFSIGTVYVTPGGQFILTLVDYYGTSFVVFILASFEMTGVIWFYGLENFLEDLEFMLDRKPSVYWRICWFIVTPFILITIFIYTIATLTPLTYGGTLLPGYAHAIGWTIFGIGIVQIPLWMLIAMLKNRKLPFIQMLKRAFAPVNEWGPREVQQRKDWRIFKEERARDREKRIQPIWKQILYVLLNMKPI
ncbi:PREDICTED: sodium-dependent nutrient amino acid transporter 1-like [Atta cephalotes]|uniref:Transporter n=1 Tax=Atta cephalotes TaxID=12957 RepID=A0A158NLZ9_ATTCE|nr:PREDICTED: sodium-dependent nutrient amino acid transporter 1-like [Atta cephalotes]